MRGVVGSSGVSRPALSDDAAQARSSSVPLEGYHMTSYSSLGKLPAFTTALFERSA